MNIFAWPLATVLTCRFRSVSDIEAKSLASNEPVPATEKYAMVTRNRHSELFCFALKIPETLSETHKSQQKDESGPAVQLPGTFTANSLRSLTTN